MKMNKSLILITTVIIFLLVVIVGSLFTVAIKQYLDKRVGVDPIVSVDGDFEFKKFSSENEFNSFVESLESLAYSPSFGSSSRFAMEELDGGDWMPMATEESFDSSTGSESKAERYSTTNVQVAEIDEIDVVKTDGENIFFSKNFWGGAYRSMPFVEFENEVDIDMEPGYYPPVSNVGVEIFKAFPVEELDSIGEIDEEGDLLLVDDILVGFDVDGIWSYDVSNPSNPTEAWSLKYGDRFGLVDARLFDNEIFLVVSDSVTYYWDNPVCPAKPLNIDMSISCTDIYYSPIATDSDSMYTIYKINALTGDVVDSVSFMGSSSGSVVYMSLENIFVTYSLTGDMMEIMYKFVAENEDLFSKQVVEDLESLKGYDISLEAKMLEFEKILEKFANTLSENARLKFENEVVNRQDSFFEQNARELSFTGIAKIENATLDVKSVGKVPGFVLNQFSLDEYEGNLRIATTVGENLWSMGNSKSVNDLYVLDEKLEILGNVLDMGKGERIYSARFIGPRGYLVTFREIDPFYVLDLEDPRVPQVKGELKIPGYSSYLHPLSDDIILGIGKEDGNVKMSLFDVSDEFNPEEVSKYILNEYWSDVLDTHKAFMLDPKFEIFFIPGNNGGYIFSYKNDRLELVESIKSYNVKRSLFIDDYLYMIGEEGITVLSQNTWKVVKEFEF